jgi:excisionase family DNA binding protein
VSGLESLPPVLTVVEAAKVLRISRNGAYELARTGKLPTLRLGRRLVVPKTALLRMLESVGADRQAG